MTRRAKMITGVGLGAALAVAGVGGLLMNSPAHAGDARGTAGRGNGELVTVYRSPNCGCCKAWEDHMRDNGYTVESVEMPSVYEVKNEHAVPGPLRSCHTALVDGYVVEGHVPAADVARLLRERPDIHGLAVAGMPSGSPGMETPGRPAERYEVYAFTEAGEAEVWAVH